jgi:hypothetical protein
MDYQRLLDTICTLRQRLAVLLLGYSGTAIKVIQVAAEKTTKRI